MEKALAHLAKDPRMALAISKIELSKLAPTGDVYFNLMESIVSQQLSVKAADTIFKRFLALFPDGKPHAEWLLEVPFEQLRAVGLSGQKAGYLQNVARFSQENDLEKRDWAAMTDDEIIQMLTQIKGVGRWTVEMVLMFTLGREDLLPLDDLGIQQGFQRLYRLEEKGKDLKKRMVEIAESWRPFRSVGCRFLWRWKDEYKDVEL